MSGPRFLKDRIDELLEQRAMNREIRELTSSLSYNTGAEDVLEALEPLHLALLFEAPVTGDPEIESMMYLILPDLYLEIQEKLREAMLLAGYEPGRTSPLLDAILTALFGRLPVSANALGTARLRADHREELLRKLADLEVMSEHLRKGEPTEAITIARVLELAQGGGAE